MWPRSLPGGSGENGRYVIVGFKLAGADGRPLITHVAFRVDQFDRFLMQLLDNSARARTERLKHNPRPEDAALDIEAAAPLGGHVLRRALRDPGRAGPRLPQHGF